MHKPIAPNSLKETRASNQGPIGNSNHHSKSMLVLVPQSGNFVPKFAVVFCQYVRALSMMPKVRITRVRVFFGRVCVCVCVCRGSDFLHEVCVCVCVCVWCDKVPSFSQLWFGSPPLLLTKLQNCFFSRSDLLGTHGRSSPAVAGRGTAFVFILFRPRAREHAAA